MTCRINITYLMEFSRTSDGVGGFCPAAEMMLSQNMLGKAGVMKLMVSEQLLIGKASTLKSAGEWPSQQPVWWCLVSLFVVWLAWEVLC